MTVLHFPTAEPRLHLAPRQPKPRRIDVRISARDSGYLYGRTKIFRLSERDFEHLIDVTIWLESRR